jgi:hypothetical protein
MTYCDIKQDAQMKKQVSEQNSTPKYRVFIPTGAAGVHIHAAIKAVITYKTTDAYTNSYQFRQSEAVPEV